MVRPSSRDAHSAWHLSVNRHRIFPLIAVNLDVLSSVYGDATGRLDNGIKYGQLTELIMGDNIAHRI